MGYFKAAKVLFKAGWILIEIKGGRDKMENITRMKVPLKTNISIGRNWLDLKEIE